MKRQFIAFIACFFLGIFAFAANSPMPLLKRTAHELVSQLRAHKSELKANPEIVNNLVKKYLVPHVDQVQMSRSVVSRADWNNATAEQRKQFVNQFRVLVIRTYSSAFSNYNDESVEFRPLRPQQLKQNYIKVSSDIIRPGQPSIPVTYSVEKKNGKWVITDFSVDGVSMVNSFKSQFASLNNHDGLPGLTAILKKHNKK